MIVNLPSARSPDPLGHGERSSPKQDWYPIFRTVSDDNAPFRQADFRSVRSFAVKPAPMARREQRWA